MSAASKDVAFQFREMCRAQTRLTIAALKGEQGEMLERMWGKKLRRELLAAARQTLRRQKEPKA